MAMAIPRMDHGCRVVTSEVRVTNKPRLTKAHDLLAILRGRLDCTCSRAGTARGVDACPTGVHTTSLQAWARRPSWCRVGGEARGPAMWGAQHLARARVTPMASWAWRTGALGLRGMASVTSTESKGKGGGGQSPDKGEHIEVPLPMHGVSGKYAAALYVTAVRGNALDPVKADLEQIASVAAMDTLFSEFMRDPSVPKSASGKACEEIFKETKFNDVTKNFMAVLAENGRLPWIERIYENYCNLLLAHKGEVNVLVTTALELTAADLDEIMKALGGVLKKGQNVKITQRVDRSIIGGIVVAIGDKHIDLSIDRKIKQMEKVLAEAI